MDEHYEKRRRWKHDQRAGSVGVLDRAWDEPK